MKICRSRRILCLLLGLFLLLPTACSDDRATLTGTLAIYTDEATTLSETEITFKEGQTVLDILQQATRDAGIQMETIGVGATAYVQGIDNLYEFDKGPESGWIYSVNGEVVQQGAGTVKPEEGDAVVWQYVLSQ